MEHFEAMLEPYSRMHDLYQTHYRTSIRMHCENARVRYQEQGKRFASTLRLLGSLRNTERIPDVLPREVRQAILDGVASLIGGKVITHTIGQYVYRTDGAQVRICIDAEDTGGIRIPHLLEWSDVYFKTNYWTGRKYPAKVLPLANVNPRVLPRQAELRSYRQARADLDLFGFFRVWGRIEHNLALFEALAQLRCRKKLLAYLISEDKTKEIQRLEKAGVSWTTRPLPLKELWDLAAGARLNIVRHGVEDCVPWRMTDMLAMGHCAVLDYQARTQWHVPLVENVHYLSLDVSPDNPLQPHEFAGRVVERVGSWLGTKYLIESVSANAAAYFDDHLTPGSMGRHIVENCRRSARLQTS